MQYAASAKAAAYENSVVPGGYDRVSSILALRPLLDEMDVKLDRVLADSGLPANQFDYPDNLIPFREGSRLLGMCADRSACEHLGLLIGMNTSLESLGILAELTQSAANIRGALKLMVRYLTLSDGGGLLTLTESEGFAIFGYAIYEPGVERTEIVYDIVLATTWNILRSLSGGQWLPVEVHFTRGSPADPDPYRKFFRAPLRFDTEHSALVFKREWLDLPLTTSDSARQQVLEKTAREIETRSTGDLSSHVRRILRRQLLGGNHSMQRVADELSVHRRTLDRRLRSDNMSFKWLVDQVRFEVSQQLLETNIPVSDIAQHLQYSNPAAYSRAFLRWSGVAPTEWRKARLSSAKP